MVGAELGIEAARRLRQLGSVEYGPGLTDAEFAAVEAEFVLEFADDHRAFLAAGLPLWTRGRCDHPAKASWGWPDWRDLASETLRAQVAWPMECAMRYIGAGHWPGGWGRRPADPAAALEKARGRLARVPRMVPVYAHRYLPGGRGSSGYPVLSIHEFSDMIVYGPDLAEYVGREFRETWTTVPFWSD